MAEYLINIDEGGEIAIRSPLNETNNISVGGWDNIRDDGYLFSAGRGTGQGDPLSPLIFACCLDPLICALAAVDSDSFQVQDLSQTNSSVPDIAYVDDAVSVTGTFAALQAKADVMSAFACLVNIELSLKKLRTFAVQWGNGSRPDHEALTVHITVDGQPWVPVSVPLKGTGEFTYLGVCYNMNLANPELFDKAAATIDDLGMKVALCRLSPDAKKMVFETCIYMKVAYYAKFSPWTLSQYRALDDKVSKFYRMISKNRANIAGDLLYIPVKHGGLGFKRLSDIIQLNKLTLMGRLITVGGPAGSAM